MHKFELNRAIFRPKADLESQGANLHRRGQKSERAGEVYRSVLGHTKIENTVRYLGVDVEDALELAESTEV